MEGYKKKTNSISRRQAMLTIARGSLYIATMTGVAFLPSTSTFGLIYSRRKFSFPSVGAILKSGFKSIAFEVVKRAANFVFDFLDIKCEHCGHIFRKLSIPLNVSMAIYCPGCSLGSRLVKAGIDLLINKLVSSGFDHAVALVSTSELNVHKVGPAFVSSGSDSRRINLYIAESIVCRDVVNRIPVDPYGLEIPYVPSELAYFTDVRGVYSDTAIAHKFFRDGQETHNIALNLRRTPNGRYRTYSHIHHNLRAGNWIALAETLNGDVLSTDYFAIEGGQQHQTHKH